MKQRQSELRRRLKAMGKAEDARHMQAYMKSTLPYYGVKSTPMRALFREAFSDYAPASAAQWASDVRELWSGATHREEKYAALALCAHRAAKAFQRFEALELYEQLVVEGAWWDLVDEVAGQRLPVLLVADRKPMTKAMRSWSKSDDLWKRRSSIICQLKLNDSMDLELLYDCIQPSLDSKEFFLRKAIGWALRQYAKKDPAEVERYVREHEARLSGLSKREALKHLA